MTLKDMLTWDCTLIPIIQIFFIGMGTLARIIPETLFLKESVLYFLKISSKSRAESLSQKQKNLPGPEKDYKTYIDCYRRAYENETRPTEQMRFLYRLLDTEAARDFDVGGLRQINHLIQMDPTPNLELKEARSEIYKISISFEPKSKVL